MVEDDGGGGGDYDDADARSIPKAQLVLNFPRLQI